MQITTYTGCGHTKKHRGGFATRDQTIEVTRDGTCPTCRREAAENLAQQVRDGLTLPQLTGTPAQIERATAIRARWVATEIIGGGHTADQLYVIYAYDNPYADTFTDPAEAIAALDAMLAARTAAAWWIENGDYIGMTLAANR